MRNCWRDEFALDSNYCTSEQLCFVYRQGLGNVCSLSLSLTHTDTHRHTHTHTHTRVCVCVFIYTGCHRRNGPNFGRVFLMLNYTDITQNTYVPSWTVIEIMAKQNCGLPSGPRTIAVSYLALSICRPLRYNNSADARRQCISLHILQGTGCGFIVSVWYTELLRCLSYFLTWNIATCILYMVFAMVIRELLL